MKKRRLAQALTFLEVARNIDTAREKYAELIAMCKELAASEQKQAS